MAVNVKELLKHELDKYRAEYEWRFPQLQEISPVSGDLPSFRNFPQFQRAESCEFNTDSNPGGAANQTNDNHTLLMKLKTNITSILSGPYQREKAGQIIQELMLILTKHSYLRKDIADFLAGLEYAESIIKHMENIGILDALESDTALTLTIPVLILCLNLSGMSSSFAKNLDKHGAVKVLTFIIMDNKYLKNGETMEEIHSLLQNSVDILNNIARHVPAKQSFVENKTANALKNLFSWNNGSLKVRAMLTLALVFEEEELLQLTDDTDVIKTIVKWIKLACCHEERTHEGFSPTELAEGLTKLAVNDFNKSMIIKEGGLLELTKMLSHDDPMEQITSAECVKTIALDAALRLNILDVGELVEALLRFRNSQDNQVFCQASSISENKDVDSDHAEDIKAQFVVDYMIFKGKIDVDDPDFKQLLYISNQQERNEALLQHVLNLEYDVVMEALAYYQKYTELFQEIIKSALSSKNTFNIPKEQVFSSFTWEQVENMVVSLVGTFIAIDNPSDEVTFSYQYSLYFIGRVFSTETVEKIGDYLAELKYPQLAVSILRQMKPQCVIERGKELALTGITICICMMYSEVSKLFAVALTENGMVDTLTTHITERCIRNNLCEKYMENMMIDFLRLIKNMSYHCDEKHKFKDSKTPEHVKHLPIRNNDNVELIVILILLNTLDEKEFNQMPDETKVLENMIEYMHRAIESKDKRSFCGISLCELTDGIRKLKPKLYKISIEHKVKVLSVLCDMLHHTDPKEQISSAVCLRALVSEKDFGNKLKEFPEIVSAMEAILRNSSINVRKYVEEALKLINLCMADNTEFSDGLTSVDGQVSGTTSATVCRTAHHHHQNCFYPTELRNYSQSQEFLTVARAWSDLPQVNYIFNIQYNAIQNNFDSEEDFTAGGKCERIKPEDEDKVIKNWDFLLEELDAKHIVDDMVTKRIFNLNDKRLIIKPVTHQKRTEILLKKLLNAGPGSAFETFLAILEPYHDHIAKKLKDVT